MIKSNLLKQIEHDTKESRKQKQLYSRKDLDKLWDRIYVNYVHGVVHIYTDNTKKVGLRTEKLDNFFRKYGFCLL